MGFLPGGDSLAKGQFDGVSRRNRPSAGISPEARLQDNPAQADQATRLPGTVPGVSGLRSPDLIAFPSRVPLRLPFQPTNQPASSLARPLPRRGIENNSLDSPCPTVLKGGALGVASTGDGEVWG
jgi:hypothetical protein